MLQASVIYPFRVAFVIFQTLYLSRTTWSFSLIELKQNIKLVSLCNVHSSLSYFLIKFDSILFYRHSNVQNKLLHFLLIQRWSIQIMFNIVSKIYFGHSRSPVASLIILS